MKEILFGILTLFLVSNIQAQDFEDLYNRLIKFESFEQYNEVDPEILEVSNYLLSNPIQRKNPSKSYFFAVKSLLKWCNHTSDYAILIFGKVIESCDSDNLMKNMYMAAMTKYLLEQRIYENRHIKPERHPSINFGELPEVKETLLEGAKIFFDYLEDVSGEKPNRNLRKGIKANKEGTLSIYMFG